METAELSKTMRALDAYVIWWKIDIPTGRENSRITAKEFARNRRRNPISNGKPETADKIPGEKNLF